MALFILSQIRTDSDGGFAPVDRMDAEGSI
jgi:hypothetical protein